MSKHLEMAERSDQDKSMVDDNDAKSNGDYVRHNDQRSKHLDDLKSAIQKLKQLQFGGMKLPLYHEGKDYFYTTGSRSVFVAAFLLISIFTLAKWS